MPRGLRAEMATERKMCAGTLRISTSPQGHLEPGQQIPHRIQQCTSPQEKLATGAAEKEQPEDLLRSSPDTLCPSSDPAGSPSTIGLQILQQRACPKRQLPTRFNLHHGWGQCTDTHGREGPARTAHAGRHEHCGDNRESDAPFVFHRSRKGRREACIRISGLRRLGHKACTVQSAGPKDNYTE